MPLNLNSSNSNERQSAHTEYFDLNMVQKKNEYQGPYTSERKSEKSHFRSASLQKNLENFGKFHDNKFEKKNHYNSNNSNNNMMFNFREMKTNPNQVHSSKVISINYPKNCKIV